MAQILVAVDNAVSRLATMQMRDPAEVALCGTKKDLLFNCQAFLK
jgi:hypothetical protein